MKAFIKLLVNKTVPQQINLTRKLKGDDGEKMSFVLWKTAKKAILKFSLDLLKVTE